MVVPWSKALMYTPLCYISLDWPRLTRLGVHRVSLGGNRVHTKRWKQGGNLRNRMYADTGWIQSGNRNYPVSTGMETGKVTLWLVLSLTKESMYTPILLHLTNFMYTSLYCISWDRPRPGCSTLLTTYQEIEKPWLFKLTKATLYTQLCCISSDWPRPDYTLDKDLVL